MKVWTNTQFEGRWPVGTAVVVVADTPERAAELLNDELAKLGLSAAAEQFERLFWSRKNACGFCAMAITEPSPHKQADPLGWPFGAIDPRELQRLLRERDANQPKPVYEPAPF